jgi:hypothetical protein
MGRLPPASCPDAKSKRADWRLNGTRSRCQQRLPGRQGYLHRAARHTCLHRVSAKDAQHALNSLSWCAQGAALEPIAGSSTRRHLALRNALEASACRLRAAALLTVSDVRTFVIIVISPAFVGLKLFELRRMGTIQHSAYDLAMHNLCRI